MPRNVIAVLLLVAGCKSQSAGAYACREQQKEAHFALCREQHACPKLREADAFLCNEACLKEAAIRHCPPIE